MKQLLFIYFFSLVAIATSDDSNLEKLLHDGNNKFTAKMFSEVAKKNSGKSFVLSAYSVLTPLAQLSLASVGESHDELLTAIGMPDDKTTKEVFSLANARLRFVKGVTLKAASKIYVSKSYELKDEFAATTKDIFNSEIQNIDFGEATAAAEEINTWVEEQTNNRIKDLVNPDNFGPFTKAVLVNAIYFKGLWQYKFNPEATTERDFHVNNNEQVKVQMMYNKADYKYTEDNYLKAQIIEIPYQGGESSLFVVLPRDIEGIKDLEEKLKDPNVLDNVRKNMYSTEVELYLPKFKIETTTDLEEVLSHMNVEKIFDPNQAKLNNLLKQALNLNVDTATQKAFIDVNEEGAEAAAANEYDFQDRSGYIRFQWIVKKFIADHPFLLYVREEQNVIFGGAYKYY